MNDNNWEHDVQYQHPSNGNDNDNDNDNNLQRYEMVSWGIGIYFLFLLTYRIIQNGYGHGDGHGHGNTKTNNITTTKQQAFQKGAIYEHCFLCNTTLFHLYYSYCGGSGVGGISAGGIGNAGGIGGRLYLYRRHRPLLIMAHLVTVSIDQVLWYIDLLGFGASLLYSICMASTTTTTTTMESTSTNSKAKAKAKFPIGVAGYLLWEDATVWTRITCTHHLWTIPLGMWLVGGVHGNMDMEMNRNVNVNMDMQVPVSVPVQQTQGAVFVFGLSAVVMCVNVVLSRFLTPSCLYYWDKENTSNENSKHDNMNVAGTGNGTPTGTGTGTPTGTGTGIHTNEKNTCKVIERKEKYLNVNLSHELWKDIKFEFLQIQYDNPSVGLYLWRLLWRWQVLNGIIYVLVLLPISKWFYP